jgi:hypothetical protein
MSVEVGALTPKSDTGRTELALRAAKVAKVLPVATFERAGGLFEVHYQRNEDLQPEAQGPLVEAIRAHSERLPAALLLHLEDGVQVVDPVLPRFWREVADNSALRMVALAILSNAAQVREDATAFTVTRSLKRRPVVVKSFPVEEHLAAQQWLVEQIHGATAEG